MLLSLIAAASVVFPRSAGALPVTDLTDLLYSAMPSSSSAIMGWQHMVQAPVKWLTVGYATYPTGITYRRGLARVRVAGRKSTVLRKQVEELAWTVELEGGINPGFGLTEISITPGSPENQCFGSLYDGCTYKAEEAVRTKRFSAKMVCAGSGGAGPIRVYSLEAAGKQQTFVRFWTEGGSGGLTTTAVVSIEKPDCER